MFHPLTRRVLLQVCFLLGVDHTTSGLLTDTIACCSRIRKATFFLTGACLVRGDTLSSTSYFLDLSP